MRYKPIQLQAQAAGLVRYDGARRGIAKVNRVNEVKSFRNKAVVMQAYAQQAKDSTLITQATEIRPRVERRAGELLRQIERRFQANIDRKGNRSWMTGRSSPIWALTSPKATAVYRQRAGARGI